MRANHYALTLLVFLFLGSTGLYSQTSTLEKVITPIGFDISKKLSDVAPIPPEYMDRSWKERVIPNKDGFLEEFKTDAIWKGPDPVLQDYMTGDRSTPTIWQNFNGMVNTSGVAPPDTDGDVGLNHYMQMVNLSFQIFNKNGTSIYGPAESNTLWEGFIGPWDGTNDGDPIVLYDQYADRWIATQFSLPNYPSGPFYELVAVSKTNDPTGEWYRYAYQFANMPDYPKFGVWPDGYYFTVNQFAPPSLSFAGAEVCVLDRAAMLIGNPNARMLTFNLGTSYGSLLPADADGPVQPAAGSPNYLANLGTNSLHIWKATIDWVNTGNSAITLLKTLTTQSFSYSGITINQPGTSQTLDPISSRLMHRLQYRNFGSYEVMLTNHTVNANGSGQAGVRWYELRNSGSGWTIYQQGTFAPADGNDRWMASVAMNGNGDIGLGYSVSSSTTYPAVRFAGQTAANSGTGVFDVSETSIHAGTSSQTGVNRWGDYSMMSIDPSNDNTFWYTNEYSNGGWNWRTKIASFTFQPPVVIAPVANFSGTPTSVMVGQQVTFSDLSTNNPTAWSWLFEGGNPSTSTEKNPVITYPTVGGPYDVSLTVTNSAGSDQETKTDYITVTEYNVTYCASSGSNTSSEWINSLTFGSYVNTSGNNHGYGDFTSSAISLESGETYNLVIGLGYSGRMRSEYWRVWIDYNMDGDFSDNGEEVFAANKMKGSVSGTLTIPAGLSGETRMRVALKYNLAPTSCEQFVYGEVEDYTLLLTPSVPQAPIADFSGSPVAVVVGNSVQFTDLSLNDPTSWSWTFAGGTPGTSTVQNPVVMYNTPGIYAVSLTATNTLGSNTKTMNGYITVTEVGTYCESHSNSNAIDYIAGVNIASFSNPSGASFYSDFTGQMIDILPGSSNIVSLSPYYGTQRAFWRIWIDMNGDGDFDDSGELLFSANNKKGVVTGSLIIPTTVTGQTRMRITMKTGGAPTTCEVFANGEVEDYTVNFGNAPAAPAAVSVGSNLNLEIYPNPANDVLNVVVTGNANAVNIKVYSALGVIIKDFNAKDRSTTINLSNFSKGIYYIGVDDGVKTALKRFIRE